ncbi:MAG: ATP-binding cassette domain-containing protein [Hyphomicrobiales bacterium]
MHVLTERERTRLKVTDAASPALAGISGLGIHRGGRWLLRNVDLSVQRGEIVTLIGPNGSGKTTCAKALLGLLACDEGEAWIAKGARIGYVPQRFVVDWTLPLTVRRLMTLTDSHSRGDVEAALEEVGISHLIDAAVQTLSGGELQRALLARALVRKPDLLVLDEPVQGVDFSGEIALYGLIRDIRDRLACGVLLISHDLHIVMAETDTVVCLNGHVCCSGTPKVVAEDPEYRKLFGPKAADALAVYRHDHDHTHAHDGSVVPLHHHHGAKDDHA